MKKLKPHEILEEIKTVLKKNYNSKQKIQLLQKEIEKLKMENMLMKANFKIIIPF